MTPADPRTAPKRTDLPFLRHRARVRPPAPAPTASSAPPAPQAPPPSPAPAPASTPSASSPALSDFITSRGTRPHSASNAPPAPTAPAPAGPSSSLDLSRPARSPSLDLSTPAPPQSLEPPTPAPSSSLDLSSPPPPAATPATPGPARARQARPVTRARPGTRTILSQQNPTVTLTRMQSGIGALGFEAAVSESVGDLRLGCAYQLRSGSSSTVQYAGGSHLAPKNSPRPVIVALHDRYERISIDLRQNRELERLIIYGFSESRAQLQWGGTLIVNALGNARIEVPLDAERSDAVTVFLSLYNIDGEFVLRAELDPIGGSIRDAAKAYGYDQITWLDDRTTVD